MAAKSRRGKGVKKVADAGQTSGIRNLGGGFKT
jgi:hypothetical protein